MERKRGRGGKDAIQDGGRHDDLANAIVGAIHLVSKNKAFNPHAVPIGVGNITRFDGGLGNMGGLGWLTDNRYYSRHEDTEDIPNGANVGARIKY